jgi:hypothetical protein
MKIQFDDRSYIEITKSNNSDKIFISVAAKDQNNSKSLIINSVELTVEQLNQLVNSLKP